MESFTKHFLKVQGFVGITADVVIFTIREERLAALLVRRANAPFKGRWALPGGFLNRGETLEQTARRELQEETGVRGDFYLEQLYTFSAPDRSPSGRVISTAFFALVNENRIRVRAGSDAKAVAWFPIGEWPRPLASDHDAILAYAVQRLRWKVEYTNAAWSLLPKRFTLGELQQIYETILGRKLDKRNFRRKILALPLLQAAGKRSGAPGPAPLLYRFRTTRPTIVEIL